MSLRHPVPPCIHARINICDTLYSYSRVTWLIHSCVEWRDTLYPPHAPVLTFLCVRLFISIHVWHDSCTHMLNEETYVTPLHPCSRSYTWDSLFVVHVWHDSSIHMFNGETQLHPCTHAHIHMCDTLCDSFMCVTWLIHVCDMTHSYVWHDSFICVTWLIHMRDTLCSFSCVTWLWVSHVTYGWVMSHINESCHTYVRHSVFVFMCHMTLSESCHIWVSHVTYEWVMSHICATLCVRFHVSHDSSTLH